MDSVAYRLRPDPSEPWRYMCLNCESTAIRINKTGDKRGFRSNGKQGEFHEYERPKRYACQSCGQSENYVWDKKKKRVKWFKR